MLHKINIQTQKYHDICWRKGQQMPIIIILIVITFHCVTSFLFYPACNNLGPSYGSEFDMLETQEDFPFKTRLQAIGTKSLSKPGEMSEKESALTQIPRDPISPVETIQSQKKIRAPIPYIGKILLQRPKGKKRKKRKNKFDLSVGASTLSARKPGEIPIVFKAFWRRVVQPWIPTVRWGAFLAPKLQMVVQVLPQPALIGIAALCANEVAQRQIQAQIQAMPPSMQPGAYNLANETLRSLGNKLDYLAQQDWKVDEFVFKEFNDLKSTGIQRSPETEMFIKQLIEVQTTQALELLTVNENITSVLTANTTSSGIHELRNLVSEEYRPRLKELEKLVKKVESGKESITFEDIFRVLIDDKLLVQLDGLKEPLKLLQSMGDTLDIIKSLELEMYDQSFFISSDVSPSQKMKFQPSFLQKTFETIENTSNQMQQNFKEVLSSIKIPKDIGQTLEEIIPQSNIVSITSWTKQMELFTQKNIIEPLLAKNAEAERENLKLQDAAEDQKKASRLEIIQERYFDVMSMSISASNQTTKDQSSVR